MDEWEGYVWCEWNGYAGILYHSICMRVGGNGGVKCGVRNVNVNRMEGHMNQEVSMKGKVRIEVES